MNPLCFVALCCLLLLSLCDAVSRTNEFVISDYLRDSPSFENYKYDSTDYVVHDVYIDVDVAKFQWVLLGQERDCEVSVDNGPRLDAILSLQGKSTKFKPLPKKQYEILLKTEDGVEHDLIFRHSYQDPSYTRQKLVHDVTYMAGGVSIAMSHVNLYVNGEYNGLYQVAEGIDSRMINNRFGPDADLWYYVQRSYTISIRDHDGTIETTSTEDMLKLNLPKLSEKEYTMYNPYYQAGNTSKTVSQVFNFTTYAGAMFARRLLSTTDIYKHNFYLVVDPTDQKLQVVMWDLDKSLGIGIHEGKSIVSEKQIQDVLVIMDRVQYFTYTTMVPTTDVLRLPHSEEFNTSEISEATAYETTARLLLDDQGAMSVPSINSAIDVYESALAKAADRDADKWSRWYCDTRMNFPESMSELRALVIDLSRNYYKLLMGQGEERVNRDFYDPYGCGDWTTGKGDPGMFAFLWTVFAVNVVAFLIPAGTLSCLIANARGIKANPKDTNANSEAGCTSGFEAAFSLYVKQCGDRFMSYDYLFNVVVGAALIITYIIYARLDMLDDSEILGKIYMADIKYVWIYFVVAINIAFLFSDNKIRLISWLIVVLASNIYSIIDLIIFVGAESDSHSVNSRGISISFNIQKEYRSVFFVFVVWRIFCQIVIMLYSLRIAPIAKEITRSIEKATTAAVSAENFEITAKKLCVGVYEVELVTAEGEDQGIGSTDDDTRQLEASDQGSREGSHAIVSEMEEIVLGGDDVVDLPVVDLESAVTPAENSGSSASKSKIGPLRGAELVSYKLRMKWFMWLNMGIFISICVGYVIYLGVEGTLKETAAEIFFSSTISVAILINIRAFYSCLKWFWLHAYGFDTDTLEVVFGNRNDDTTWSLDKLTAMKIETRESAFSFLLPGQNLSTEKKIRSVDGWTKKIAHTYDGLLVFIVSSQSFAEDENSSEAFSLAYAISLIYMLLYVISYNGEGSLAWILYGAKARIMDGFLGRENEIFGYMFDKYMLPVSAPLLLWLKSSSGDDEIIILSWYIFMPIIVGDSFAEIVGSTWGKQRIKVWGMGEINKKSWEGTMAMFFSSFFILIAVNIAVGLSWEWYLFAIVNCFVATVVELYAYRSTDNVCMLILSALLSVAFIHIK